MPLKKTTRFRQLLASPELEFLIEAHNGISAQIGEEAGFRGIWAGGLCMSAQYGVRDSNEASWTQVLEMLEFMADATSIPILLDGDTGYGNFNNVRRLVRKLEQRGIAAVCIEDKLYPKTNSFIDGDKQQLADVDEFCSRIKAGKDAQADDEFAIITRVEAFIAGWGLDEAMRRAEAYHAAGSDGILIHSALSSATEVLAFQKEWAGRSPVVIVPTKYHATPTEVFREAGFSIAIWANQLLRAAVVAMQDEVPMEMARELVENFYNNLLQDGVVDMALNRSRMLSFDPEGLLDSWTIPVLFTRTPRGRLFTANRERETLRAISESPTFRPMFKYGFPPLEAVMLNGYQIKPNWENQVLPQQERVDLHSQLQSLLENFEGKQPLLIAITGQRGTERSAAMRWMVMCTAKDSLEGGARDQILPVYVDLQKCVSPSAAVPSYLTMLAQSLGEFWPGGLAEKEMDNLLGDRKHKFRFFFDHDVDLSESQRKAFMKELNKLVNDFPVHPCFVTKTRGLWDWAASDVTHVLDVLAQNLK